eukprot:TRINITY_DN2210_c0_g1_i1.p1 TRINITY_DN2210_c0_g1~~TRINITY_DN2210_c0_g1_i1.p1  ORF type:complete len:416 (+),score=128.84 TRINITY_DN2210_c0_g1_i1:84-1250(+)
MAPGDYGSHVVSPPLTCSKISVEERLIGGSVETRDSHKWAVAITCVVVMNGTWLFMAEALQNIGSKWDHYYMEAYVVQSSYSYCLVVWGVWTLLKRPEQPTEHREPVSRMLKVAAGGCALAIGARWAWYVSLAHTNAAANSAIYQTSSLVAYVLSIPTLGAEIHAVKIFSLLLCIGAVALIAVYTEKSKEDGVQQTTAGYCWLCLSVLLYSLHLIFVKKYSVLPTDPHPHMSCLRFSGLMGVIWLTTGWMLAPVLHYTGIEEFGLPSSEVAGILALNGVADALFEVGVVICICVTSPTFAAVSGLLVVPLTMLADFVLHSFVPPPMAIVGMICIAVGFSLFSWSMVQDDRETEQPDPVDEEKPLPGESLSWGPDIAALAIGQRASEQE